VAVSNYRKVLSIKQPWAWLIVNGYKDIENRSWSTKFRGRFFVHASKKIDMRGYESVRKHHPWIEMPEPKDFFFGGVVGTAVVTDCVTETCSPWFVGEYGFTLADAKPMTPIPLKGQLGFFDAPESIIASLKVSQ